MRVGLAPGIVIAVIFYVRAKTALAKVGLGPVKLICTPVLPGHHNAKVHRANGDRVFLCGKMQDFTGVWFTVNLHKSFKPILRLRTEARYLCRISLILISLTIRLEICAFCIFGRPPEKAVIDTAPFNTREVNLSV